MPFVSGKGMRMMKWKAAALTLMGILVAGTLFMLGDLDDAPGLSFLGLAGGFLLVMRGIYYTGWLKAGYHLPVILFVFGAVAIVFPLVLYLDGELEGLHLLAPISISAGIAMVAVGWKKIKNKK